MINKTNIIAISALAVALFLSVDAVAQGHHSGGGSHSGGTGGSTGGSSITQYLLGSDSYVFTKGGQLTVFVSSIESFRNTSFLVGYDVIDSNGTVLRSVEMDGYQTLENTPGQEYTFDDELNAGEMVNLWVKDSGLTYPSQFNFLSEDISNSSEYQLGWANSQDNYLMLTVPKTGSGGDNPSYTLTFKGGAIVNAAGDVVGGTGTGGPLPGVWATIALAGAVGSYLKRRRNK